jgi:hypothetical protein
MYRITAMKVLPILAMMACSVVFAETPAKPLLSLSVKTKVLDSDSDLRGKRGSSKQKTMTLRIEITNTSPTSVESASLSAIALVRRSGDFKDRLIKESLGSKKLEALKPNEKITVDIGRIDLHEVEWKARKFEESLEGWQVVCKQNGAEIGKAESDHYPELEKDAVNPQPRTKASGPGKRQRQK